MSDNGFQDLMNNVLRYIKNEDEIKLISRAYLCALELHKGQKRESGEEYIVHPVAVAFILSNMQADADTITAALLHDTVEDTNMTKENIAEIFNPTVANLVDGVTKISKMNFSSKEEAKASNTRKIITSITNDVRIIIIKLADRLHNMRTLEYKTEFKQKENAIETMEIYVPLAYYLGAFRIKNQLEDLSLKYLKPDTYLDIQQRLEIIKAETQPVVKEMLSDISNVLDDNDIHHEIKMRTKNVYGVYKTEMAGKKITDIHDLSTLKIMVDEIRDCYLTLMHVHSKYRPLNKEFKDYIASPKTNMYSSLHTTLFGKDDQLVQVQIRTFIMELVAEKGLTAYWELNGNKDTISMQEELKSKFQFLKSLEEISELPIGDQEFIDKIKGELFSNKVYAYTPKGKAIELPEGSTPVDFAYRIHSNIGDNMLKVLVNEDEVAVDYIIQNKDRVRILVASEEFIGPKLDWHGNAYTSSAKRKIKEFNNKMYSEQYGLPKW